MHWRHWWPLPEMPLAYRAAERFVHKLLPTKSIRISFLSHVFIYLFIYAAHDIQESIYCNPEMTFNDEDKVMSLSLLIGSLAFDHNHCSGTANLIPCSVICKFNLFTWEISHLSPGRAWLCCQETLWYSDIPPLPWPPMASRQPWPCPCGHQAALYLSNLANSSSVRTVLPLLVHDLPPCDSGPGIPDLEPCWTGPRDACRVKGM